MCHTWALSKGCPLSPTLFGLYLDKQVFRVHHDLLDLPNLPIQRIPVLQYADNSAMVTTSPEGLQAQLDLLHANAPKWKLTIKI